MQFDPSKLEDVGALEGAELTVAELQMVIAYSQAVSLRRIADMMEAHAHPLVTVASGESADPRFTFGRSLAPAEKPRVKRRLTDVAVPEGFTAWDNDKSESPVDRNADLMVLHANGKQRRNAAGSVQWMTQPDDPWRVVAYAVAGDGSTASVE